MSWHIDDHLIADYASGALDHARASSVEAHVMSCAQCRTAIAGASDRARLDRIFVELTDAVDRPVPGPVEAMLRRLGVRAHIARLITATPALSGSWLLSIVTALTFAVLGAHAGDRGVLAFLVLAPLVPLAGVAFSYGPGIDPTYEIGVAAPLSNMRLLLIRAGTVVGTSILMLGAASAFLPAMGWRAAAWLLPALCFSLIALALSTWFDARATATALGAGWLGALIVGSSLRRGVPILDRVGAFQAEGQIAFAALALVAVAVLIGRRDRIEAGGPR